MLYVDPPAWPARAQQTMSAFTLAHLSDPHVPPMPAPTWRELMSQRVLGYVNWKRNRHLYHRRDMLDVLVVPIGGRGPSTPSSRPWRGC